MSERYKVVEGSKSAHCCFEATVVDTQISSLPLHDERGRVCECFGMESAQKIADALNAAQQSAPDVEALMDALEGAARSLETIGRQAGIDEYMSDFSEVRGYARNRAMVAFNALAALKNGVSRAV